MASAFHRSSLFAHVDSLKNMRRLLSMLVPGLPTLGANNLDAAVRRDEEPVEAQEIHHPGAHLRDELPVFGDVGERDAVVGLRGLHLPYELAEACAEVETGIGGLPLRLDVPALSGRRVRA